MVEQFLSQKFTVCKAST